MYQFLGSSGNSLYNMLDVLATVALFIFNLSQYKQKAALQSYGTSYLQNLFSKRNTDKKTNILSYSVIWIILEIVIFSVVQYILTASFNREFGNMLQTGVNYFGRLYHIPFLITAFCILIWVDPCKQIDLITPAYPLALFVSKIGCFCQGCCAGIEWAGGLYNHSSERYEFPIQLVEAGLALLIFVFLLFWRNKAKPGTMFPTYLILYSATRFFSEFLSGKPDYIWMLKKYHILCIIGVVVGIIELLIALKFGEKISKFFQETHYCIPNEKKKKKKNKKKA